MTATTTPVITLDNAVDLLRERVRETYPLQKSTTVTVEIPACDPLTWLEMHTQGSRIYWATPDGLTEIAGLGVAHLVTADRLSQLDSFQQMINEEASRDTWYFGGVRFDRGAQEADSRWESYHGGSFVRPRLVLVRKGERHALTCHLVEGDSEEEVLSQLDEVKLPAIAIADERIPDVLNVQETADRDQFMAQVESILGRIEEGEITKQVLARKVDLRLTRALTPFQLMRKMRQRAPRCYHFIVSSEPGSAFLGATPEMLYTRAGDELRCEAVAGTRSRGATDEDTERLGRELLDDPKERHEHQLVADHIEGVLEGLCQEVTVDSDPSVLRRGDWQHLFKSFEAVLQPGVTDLRILKELSPTPAVAAVDTAEIRKMEEFDRGWYAGPIGWISPNASEFAVGIRSALLNEDHLTLYAGVGVVEGSDPLKEWEESQTKLSTILKIFDL